METPCVLVEQVNEGPNTSASESCLGHVRITDANAKILKRQLKEFRQCEEACRQGDLEGWRLQGVEISDVMGRKQIQRHRLVTEGGASASRGLPITGKAYVRQTLLLVHTVFQQKAPAKDGECG